MARRDDQFAEALQVAREARYWAERYREASERVERAVLVIEEEGGPEDATDRR